MSVKSYQKIIPATAIKFEGNSSTHTDEIFAFVQVIFDPLQVPVRNGDECRGLLIKSVVTL